MLYCPSVRYCNCYDRYTRKPATDNNFIESVQCYLGDRHLGKKTPPTNNRPGRPSTAGIVNGSRIDQPTRELANIFKSLSDPNRLKILQLLSQNGEMHVSSISEELSQSQPAVSHHLTQLRSSGLIEFRRAGKFNYYAISPSGLAELFGELCPSGASPKILIGGVEMTLKWKG